MPDGRDRVAVCRDMACPLWTHSRAIATLVAEIGQYGDLKCLLNTVGFAGRNRDIVPIKTQLRQAQIEGLCLVGLQREIRTNTNANTAIDIAIQAA